MKGVNIFSHSGSIAAGLLDYITPCLYTASTVATKSLLEKTIAKGIIPQAPIEKFVYNLNHDNIPEDIDIVYGLVQDYKYQKREHVTPNKDGLLKIDDIPITKQDRFKLHLNVLYESVIINKCCNSKEILLFFTYNPLFDGNEREKIISLFTTRGFRLFCMQVILDGELNVSESLYILHAYQTPILEKGEKIYELELSITPDIESYNIKEDDNNIRIVLWDIAPSIIKKSYELLKKIEEELTTQKEVIIIRSLLQPVKKCWNYNDLSLGEIYTLKNQPFKQIKECAPLLGWPLKWLINDISNQF